MTYSFLPRTSWTLAAALLGALAVVVGCSEKEPESSVNNEVSAAVDKAYQEKIDAVEKAQVEIRRQLAKAHRDYNEAKARGASAAELERFEKKISSIESELKKEKANAYRAVRERIKAQTR